MIFTQTLNEDKKEVNEQNLERQILQSKLRSLNSHLAALIQKKIRLDLEIKHTKKKITKMKNQSKTEVKTRLSMEGYDYDAFDPQELPVLLEKVGQEEYDSIYALDEQIVLAEKLLEEYSDLPLYQD